jgi:hypothetical protein
MGEKVTITRDDAKVYLGGDAQTVSTADLPEFIHAVQWDPDKGVGEIEFKADSRGVRMGNVKITDMTPFQYLVDGHALAKAERAAKGEQEQRAKIAQLEKAQKL